MKKQEEQEFITVILRSVNPKGSNLVPGYIYSTKDNTGRSVERVLLNGYKDAALKANLSKDAMLAGVTFISAKQPFQLRLPVDKLKHCKDFHENPIQYAHISGGDKKGNKLTNEYMRVLVFLADHPSIELKDDNDYLSKSASQRISKGEALFELEIKENEVSKRVAKIEKNLNRASLFLSLNDEELREITYSLNVDPNAFTREDLTCLLLGDSFNGLIYNNVTAKGENLFDSLMAKQPEERQYEFNVRKAIFRKVIVEESNVYKMHTGEPLGTSIDAVIANLKEQPKLYDFILQQIGQSDKGGKAAEDIEDDDEHYDEPGLDVDLGNTTDPAILALQKKKPGRKPAAKK